MAPGVPASITSLGPYGYNFVCNQPACASPFGPNFAPVIARPTHGGGNHGHHHHPGRGYGYGGYGYGYTGYTYVPYAYPVPVAVAPEDEGQDVQQPEEPEPPAPTVYERRPVVQPAPYTTQPPAEQAVDSNPKHVNLSPVSEEKIPVVVVFKDGHQQEIANGNYAIVGDMLYDLSGPIAKKIKLSDVDLDQTVQANEQRGVEFSVPAGYKPQV